MSRWEYITVIDPSDDQLNAMGEEDWELVAVTSPVWLRGAEEDYEQAKACAYFRRQKPELSAADMADGMSRLVNAIEFGKWAVKHVGTIEGALEEFGEGATEDHRANIALREMPK